MLQNIDNLAMDQERARSQRAMSEMVGEESDKGVRGDKFDGTGNYQAWKRKWRVTLLAEDKTNLWKAKELFKHITGNASIMLLADITDEDLTFPFGSPAEIFAILDASYGEASEASGADAMATLMRLRQAGKTVDEYALEFEGLTPIAKIKGDNKIAMFIEGLSLDVRTIMGVANFSSWPGVLRAARRAETMAQAQKRLANRRGPARPGRSGPHRGAMTRGATEERLCFSCNKAGHMARDCPANGKGGSRGQTRGARNTNARGRRAQEDFEEEDEYDFELAGNESRR